MLALIETLAVQRAAPRLVVDRRVALLAGVAAAALPLFGVQSANASLSTDLELQRLGHRIRAMYPRETELPASISVATPDAVTAVANLFTHRLGQKSIFVEGWHLSPEAVARCLISTVPAGELRV